MSWRQGAETLDRYAQGACEMGRRTVHGEHKIDAVHDGSGVDEVIGAVVESW